MGKFREQSSLYPPRDVLVGLKVGDVERKETPLRKEGRGVHLSKKKSKDEVSFITIHGTV